VPDPKLKNEIKEPHFYYLLLPILSNDQRNLQKSSRPAENSPFSTTYIVEGDGSLEPGDPKPGPAKIDQAA